MIIILFCYSLLLPFLTLKIYNKLCLFQKVNPKMWRKLSSYQHYVCDGIHDTLQVAKRGLIWKDSKGIHNLSDLHGSKRFLQTSKQKMPQRDNVVLILLLQQRQVIHFLKGIQLGEHVQLQWRIPLCINGEFYVCKDR